MTPEDFKAYLKGRRALASARVEKLRVPESTYYNQPYEFHEQYGAREELDNIIRELTDRGVL